MGDLTRNGGGAFRQHGVERAVEEFLAYEIADVDWVVGDGDCGAWLGDGNCGTWFRDDG